MVDIIAIGKAAPVPDVIEEAEKLLELAKAGELRSLMWLGDGGDAMLSGWTPVDDVFRLLAQSARLQHRIQLRIDDPSEAL